MIISGCLERTITYNVTADFDLYSVYLDGPDFVCGSTATFTLHNLPQPCTISWDGQPPVTDSEYTVYTSLCPGPGVAKVYAKVNYQGRELDLEHRFSFNHPGYINVSDTVIYDQGVGYNEGKGVYSLGVSYAYPAAGINYDWTCFGWQLVSGGTDYAVFEGNSNGGVITVRLCFTNPCGGYTCLFRDIYPTGGGYQLNFSPNPSSTETILTIVPSTKENFVSQDIGWELEIYAPGQLLKEKKTKLKGSKAVINTSGWNDGIYIVRVKYDGKILTGKLVVKQ